MSLSSEESSWRAFLMPIDAVKTSLQVEGKAGLQILGNKIKTKTHLYYTMEQSFQRELLL